MGCACSDKKKLNYDYVRQLANAESITKQIDIQIYFTIGFDGKTKYYDYEPTITGRKLQVVEVIRFSQPESSEILSDNVGEELTIVEQEEIRPRSTKRKPSATIIEPMGGDSGTI